jgi:hypothetical protein
MGVVRTLHVRMAKPQEVRSGNHRKNRMLQMAFRQWKKPLVPSEHGRITSVPPKIEPECCHFRGRPRSGMVSSNLTILRRFRVLL